MYKPDDTLALLRKAMSENNVDMVFSKDTIYCVDNESVRYLAGIKNKETYNEDHRKIFSESWNQSAEEAERMLKYIFSRRPNPVKQMLAINEARQTIINLAESLAEITNAIQENVTAIETARRNGKEFYIPVVDIEKEAFECTQSICTSETCTTYEAKGNEKRHQFKCIQKYDLDTWCHSNYACTICGCDESLHRQFTHKTVFTEHSDETVMLVSQTTEDDDVRQAYEKQLDIRDNELKIEQNEITKRQADFACFLKTNALKPYNDIMIEYLDFFIKARGDVNKATRENLENVCKRYKEEVSILQTALTNPNSNVDPLNLDNIRIVIDRLYSMKHVGEMLRKLRDNSVTENVESEVFARKQTIEMTNSRQDQHMLITVNSLFTKGRGKKRLV